MALSGRMIGFMSYSYTNQHQPMESILHWLWSELAVEQKAEASIDTRISRNAQIQTSCGMILGMSAGFV